MKNESVFIIGVSGLVGQACSTFFAEQGCYIHGFARNLDLNQGSENCKFYNLDLTNDDFVLLDLYQKIKPKFLIFAAGNHQNDNSTEMALLLFKLHLDFTYKLIKVADDKNINTNMVFCSSIMSFIPDRRYPFYSASKAGLNQLLLSAISSESFGFPIAILALGPISANPTAWFEQSTDKLAKKIYSICKSGKSGIIYLPWYGKILAFLAWLSPINLEKLIINSRIKK